MRKGPERPLEEIDILEALLRHGAMKTGRLAKTTELSAHVVERFLPGMRSRNLVQTSRRGKHSLTDFGIRIASEPRVP